MKEQVKAIVYDFKDAGWTVQKIEQELKFSNGTLGKVMNDVAGMSDFKFSKLLELHQREIKKPPTVTKELADKIAENNLPENKARILAERNTVHNIGKKFEDIQPLPETEMQARIAKLEEKLKLPAKYLPKWQRTPIEKELAELKLKESI